LLQVTDRSRWPRWGFALLSEDQCWEGGFGIARQWEVVAPDEVPERIRQEFDEVLESLLEYRNQAVPLQSEHLLGGFVQ
jgi:hypothetical protein